VVRSNPMRSLVRWPSPIAFMPFVMLCYRIPVTLYPHESSLRHWGNNGNHTGRRWRPNHDSPSVLQVLQLRACSSDASGCNTASYEFSFLVRNERPGIRIPSRPP
jgi:hypothetical protein